jgi:hypothetical protein
MKDARSVGKGDYTLTVYTCRGDMISVIVHHIGHHKVRRLRYFVHHYHVPCQQKEKRYKHTSLLNTSCNSRRKKNTKRDSVVLVVVRTCGI